MSMKVLEIEGQYAFGIMGSLANITKVMNALDQCTMVDVSFDHDPEGTSQYYAVASERNRNFTIRELPTLTKPEFDALQKHREEERELAKEQEALEKEFEEKGIEPNVLQEEAEEEPPCCMTGCAICKPEEYLDHKCTCSTQCVGECTGGDKEYDPETDCGCNGNKTCSECR
jgi:hypothetical protein